MAKSKDEAVKVETPKASGLEAVVDKLQKQVGFLMRDFEKRNPLKKARKRLVKKLGYSRWMLLAGMAVVLIAGAAIAGQVKRTSQGDQNYMPNRFIVRKSGMVETSNGVIAHGSITASNGFTGAITLTGDITLENGEEIENSTDLLVAIEYDDTSATNKGSFALDSASVATNADDTAVFNFIPFRMMNDSSQVIDWSTLQVQVVDNTTNTEDSVVRIKVQVGGVETTLLTLDVNGVTAGGTVGFVGNGASLTNLNAAALLAGSLPMARITNGAITADKLNASIVTNVLAAGMVLPAVDGNAVTNLNAGAILAGGTFLALDGGALTNLSAANLLAGTVATAIDGNAITNVNAGSMIAGGTFLALDGGALTNLTAGNVLAGGVFGAIDGNALTNLNAGAILAGGTFLALDGGALTNINGFATASNFAVTNNMIGSTNIMYFTNNMLGSVVLNP